MSQIVQCSSSLGCDQRTSKPFGEGWGAWGRTDDFVRRDDGYYLPTDAPREYLCPVHNEWAQAFRASSSTFKSVGAAPGAKPPGGVRYETVDGVRYEVRDSRR